MRHPLCPFRFILLFLAAGVNDYYRRYNVAKVLLRLVSHLAVKPCVVIQCRCSECVLLGSIVRVPAASQMMMRLCGSRR